MSKNHDFAQLQIDAKSYRSKAPSKALFTTLCSVKSSAY